MIKGLSNISYWMLIGGLLLKYCNSLPDLLIYGSIALSVYTVGLFLIGFREYF